MYDLNRFSMGDMTACGADLRKLGSGAKTMEEAANRMVRYLYDHLLNGQQAAAKACVLVRFFKTQSFDQLQPQLQRVALEVLGKPPESPGMKCLTLLASAGARPEWNARESSAGHQVIPLPSAEIVLRIPMIAQLIAQLGLGLAAVLQPDPTLMIDLAQRTYNVFHIPDAVGSPYIPAQKDFVVPFGVRSVLGFGGLM